MSEPTKTGYYWAKDAVGGGGEDWEIVRVWTSEGRLICDAWGGSTVWELSDFTFGPEVTKPEGLE